MRSIVLAALAIAALLGPAAAHADGYRVGAPAPEVVVKGLQGQSIDLDKLKGHVVVANVWATWCGPCRAEMPMLDAFYRAHRGQGVELIGLSADRTRDLSAVRRVMSGFSYPAGLLAQARVDRLGEVRVLPVTLVIDRAGVVRDVFGANGTPLTEARLEAAVKPLL